MGRIAPCPCKGDETPLTARRPLLRRYNPTVPRKLRKAAGTTGPVALVVGNGRLQLSQAGVDVACRGGRPSYMKLATLPIAIVACSALRNREPTVEPSSMSAASTPASQPPMCSVSCVMAAISSCSAFMTDRVAAARHGLLRRFIVAGCSLNAGSTTPRSPASSASTIVQADDARPEARHAWRPALVAHRMMARVAVEQDQFREEPVVAALRVRQQFDRCRHRERLPDRPNLDAVPHALAFFPVGVDLEVRGLHRGERFELERQPRMACGCVKPIGIAEMARQAQIRARCGSSVG